MIAPRQARGAVRPLLIAISVLVMLASCERFRGPRTEFDAKRSMTYIKTQLDFGNRIPGSLGAQRTGDWIVQRMKALADTVSEQRWNHVTVSGDTLPLRNILARFRPAATDRVLYVTHWDTRPISDGSKVASQRAVPVPGANDGASGVALFISLAEVLKKTPPSVGVDLLFVDGEDYGDFTEGHDQDVLLGSRYFAEHLPTPGYKPLFGVLWDMIGDRDLDIYQEANSLASAPEVVTRVWAQAHDFGYDKYFLDQRGETVTDDHIPLLKVGLHVIDVIDLDYPWHHTPQDTFDKVSAKSMQIVGDVAVGLVK